MILLALLLIQVRNWFGLWSILISAAVVFAVSWWLQPQVQSAFAYSLAWFLLLAAPRPVLELQRQRHQSQRHPTQAHQTQRHQGHQGRGAGAMSSDADQLARLTNVPAIVWVGFFLVTTVGALAPGASWMVTAAA